MNGKQSSKSKSNIELAIRQISRRYFLKISGTGLFIFFAPPTFGEIDSEQRRPGYPTDFNAYLKIGENNRVTLYCSKIEMGQGIYTSMAQMLAEELDVSLDSVDMVMGDTMFCPWDSGTTGSRSTKYYGPPLRKAGAEARAVLLQIASKEIGVSRELLYVKNGVIRDKTNTANKITYGELVKGKRIERHLPDVPIKSWKEHAVSGKSFLRTDARQKVTGEAKFAGDIRLPGMLYAKVLRPPSHEARLISADLSGAKKVKGVIAVEEADNLIAVLHENPEIAEQALALITSKWEEKKPGFDNQSVFESLKKEARDGRIHVEKGNLAAGKSMAKKNVGSEFYNHYVAHSPIEPYTVLADVNKDFTTVWASTQAPFRVRSTAAETLNIPEEKVRVITPFLGGGFGGKKSGQQISEAVRLSKLIDRPVQIAWTRKEEFFYDAFRPAALVQMESGLNSEGRITFWDCNLLFTGSRSSEPIYDIPNYRVKSSSGRIHPFNTGAWRGPGSNTNVFAMESHTDILAKAAGMDPLEFRMKNLTDKRMIRVIQAATDKFGQSFKPGPSGLGYGISCTNYLNTYVATIAQVAVNKTTGEVKVVRVVSAQDMGEIINPQGAELQVEGGITMGLSAALYEEIEFSGGKIKTENFDSYRITRFSDVPKIDAVLIDNPEIPPQGCGEPAITTIGAALANAIFDAVGARVYTLPLTPERILEALD